MLIYNIVVQTSLIGELKKGGIQERLGERRKLISNSDASGSDDSKIISGRFPPTLRYYNNTE